MRRYVARFMTILILILSTFTCLDLLYQDNKDKLKPTTMATTINNITSETTSTTQTTTKTVKTTQKTTKKTTKYRTTVNNGTYKLTHYGWDCKGCGGNTASGYNVRNTIYYNDITYAKLRIVAMKDLPLYSVIKIKNYDDRDIFAIVLDRGVGSGVIDLLVENEKTASKLGIRKNIEIEVLRYGKN